MAASGNKGYAGPFTGAWAAVTGLRYCINGAALAFVPAAVV